MNKDVFTVDACAVIPCYNHGRMLFPLMEVLRENALPVVLVDDGSDEETKADILRLVRTFPEINLVTLPKNRGKGAAVSAGLFTANKLGFSHALQIDADGQHDLSAIPFFLKAAEKHPRALIGGMPQYDKSVPKSREHGRKITNFWVSVETLSRDIPDAMCGFRVYPLKSTNKLLKRGFSDDRMGFDIEILVRLYWGNVKMYFYPVKVSYPEGGTSHFRMIRDNLRISRLHAILFFGMLVRAPLLLYRKIKSHGKK